MAAMARWLDLFDVFPDDETDVWVVIESVLRRAHADFYDELRLKRDQYSEIMYGPRPLKASDGGSVRNASSDKTNASSGVHKARQAGNGAVEREAQHHVQDDEAEEDVEEEEELGVEDEEEQDLGFDQGEEEPEIVVLEEEEEDEEADEGVAHHDDFDDDVAALTDDIERERLLMDEIYNIKLTIEGPSAGSLSEKDAMDILYRIEELNPSLDVLKDSKIGKSVIRFSRRHPVQHVKHKAKEMVSSWKALVDEYCKDTRDDIPAGSASANEDCVPMGEEEVGLPSPPLDEDGLLAARTVEIENIFNFSESDLSVASAASGPSPASDGPSAVHHLGRKSSSSPDEDHVRRDGKGGGSKQGLARVLKVERNRPVQLERKPGQDQQRSAAAQSNGRARPVGNKPSIERAASQVRSSTATTSATNKSSERGSTQVRSSTATTSVTLGVKEELSARPGAGNVRRGGESRDHLTNGRSAGVPRATPSVGALRLKEPTKPGLAIKVDPTPGDIDAAIMHSKRQLQQGYAVIANAKKQRTVQPLELTELPKGGPKAQKLGQRWVKSK